MTITNYVANSAWLLVYLLYSVTFHDLTKVQRYQSKYKPILFVCLKVFIWGLLTVTNHTSLFGLYSGHLLIVLNYRKMSYPVSYFIINARICDPYDKLLNVKQLGRKSQNIFGTSIFNCCRHSILGGLAEVIGHYSDLSFQHVNTKTQAYFRKFGFFRIIFLHNIYPTLV